MKAIYFEKHGDPGVLTLGERPAPALGPGQVRIDVRASSLNHIDCFLRGGLPGVKLELPHIPGCDASGVVSELGAGVTTHKVGDRVLMNPSLTCGKCEFCQRGDVSMCIQFKLVGEHTSGTTCAQIVLPAENAIHFPDAMSFEDAASVPLVFVTAWRMLITRGRLRAGEDVLIHGASAGVGIACIQIAKVAGARVFAAASTEEKLELCRSLGADVLINGEKEDVARRVRELTGRRGMDMVVDYVGKATWGKSLQCVSRGGRIVTCGATTGYNPEEDLRHIFYRQLEVIGSTMGSRNELLAPLKLIFEGKMRPVVSAVYDIENTAEAHRAMEARKTLGKIVIKVS